MTNDLSIKLAGHINNMLMQVDPHDALTILNLAQQDALIRFLEHKSDERLSEQMNLLSKKILAGLHVIDSDPVDHHSSPQAKNHS